MKKIISTVCICSLIFSLFSLSAFAESNSWTETGGKFGKYNNLPEKVYSSDEYDQIVNAEYDLTKLVDVDGLGWKGLQYKITKPSTVYAGVTYLNGEQTTIIPISYDYEIMAEMIGQSGNDPHWVNLSQPQYGSECEETEDIVLDITQDMINKAGGNYLLTVSVKAVKFPDVPLEDLGQTIHSSYIRIYQKKTDITTNGGSKDKEVKAKYVEAQKDDVYSVDVDWGNLEFEYVQAKQKWDTVNHKYVNAEGSSSVWRVKNINDNIITVKNNSSKAVDATFSFAAAPSFTGMNGEFTYNGSAFTNAVTLEKPTANVDAKAYNISFMPTSALSSETTTKSTIGTITVTLDSSDDAGSHEDEGDSFGD